MSALRRLAVILGVFLLVGSGAGVAYAQDEIEDYLEDAAEAEYSGSQVVVTYWGDERVAGAYDVGQAEGLTVVGGALSPVMLGEGKLNDGRNNRALDGWATWRLSDRYTMSAPVADERLGRAVTVVTVLDEGRARMKIAFDDATGAPLLSEVFDGDGDAYRIAVMLDFSSEPVRMPRPDQARSEYTLIGPAAVKTLPESAGGYWRADTYAGPDATIHAFYTDGLFSFSVFEFAGRADEGGFADGKKLEAGGETYRRISTPGSVLVFWRSSDATYVLVGGLPPDHLQEVLVELPEPGDVGLLGRIWRGVFG